MGGLQYIHYDCLKSWFKTKEYRQVSVHYTSIYWNHFECELCKTSLPYVFRCNGRSYPIFELWNLEPTKGYLVLESLTLENKRQRMVHILHPQAPKKYNMGRAQECDIKVSDISVSRNHCYIRYNDGKFYLQDISSKFGTLCLNRGKTEIPPGCTMGMQVGRTLFVM